jgi:tRNA pseudouridine55 synthase
MEFVLNVFKPEGLTPLEMLRAYRKQYAEYASVPMTYAGRLDPIAEGVLLVLAGNEAGRRDQYLRLDKEYVAEIVLGLETDTGDVLGIAKESNIQFASRQSKFKFEKELVCMTLQSLQGKIVLPVPAYSSVPVKGKPLFEWARSGKLENADIPKREMEFYKIELIDMYEMYSGEIVREAESRICKVSGDFRQNEIKHRWRKVLSQMNAGLPVIKIKIHCASGAYIRSLAACIGAKLNMPAFLNRLTRTRVRKYHLTDSIRIGM